MKHKLVAATAAILSTIAPAHAQPASTEPALSVSKGSGQARPQRPIRIVVGFPPGGGIDVVARLLGVPVGQALGQQIVVDNRPGANGILGTEIVAKAAPDGHTFLSAPPAT